MHAHVLAQRKSTALLCFVLLQKNEEAGHQERRPADTMLGSAASRYYDTIIKKKAFATRENNQVCFLSTNTEAPSAPVDSWQDDE